MRLVQIKRLWISILLMLSSLALPALAVNPFEIQDIQIDGLERVDPGTIFAVVPFRVGDIYDDEKGSTAIRNIVALGTLQDAHLEVGDNGILRIVVQERASIAEVSFGGFIEFPKTQIADIAKSLGLVAGKPFDRSIVDNVVKALTELYIQRGFYSVKIKETATPIERNRVNVHLQATEGEVAKINSISIVGNNAFDESTVLSQMDLSPSGFFSWYTKNDRYAISRLNADLEDIKSFYTRRGYLEFKIEATDIDLSEDKTEVNIVVHIHEGKQFTVTKVQLDGDYLGYKNLFSALVEVAPGSIYNSEAINQTITALTTQFGNFGYAFATVDVIPKLDRDAGTAELIIQADPLERAYVRFINIRGNRKTRDEVIRRELRQLEGSWYNGDLVRLSRDRLTRLGYFNAVDIQLQEVQAHPDQADLDILVEDAATGNIRLGIGYSSTDKLGLIFGISQDNIFGSGQLLALEVNTNSRDRAFQVSSINPYFTLSGISRSLDLYYTTQRPSTASDSDYKLVTTGGALRFGIPYSEEDRVFYGIGYNRYEFTEGDALPLSFQRYIEQFGATSHTVPLTIAWTRDSRDSPITPNQGKLMRLNFEYSPIGAKYYRTDAQYQQYFPLTKASTLAFNLEAGYGKGVGGRPYPVFQNFIGGGIGSVRGFENGTLGPIDASGSFPGGNKSVLFSTEVTLPFPGLGNDRSARWFLFNDLGNVFGEDQKLSLGELRDSVGLGFAWISPVGPLKFSYAFPIRKKNSDKISRFQFQVGTSF